MCMCEYSGYPCPDCADRVAEQEREIGQRAARLKTCEDAVIEAALAFVDEENSRSVVDLRVAVKALKREYVS